MLDFRAPCPACSAEAVWYVQEPAAAAQAVRTEHYTVSCRTCVTVLRETA